MWQDSNIHESTQRGSKKGMLKMTLTYLPTGHQVTGEGKNREKLRKKLEKKLSSYLLLEKETQ